MISNDKIIEIFCKLGDFYKEYNTPISRNNICDRLPLKRRKRKFEKLDSNVINILVIFLLKSY